MPNGQQRGAENLDKFLDWQATQTHDTYKQIIYQGQLNRREIAKQAGFGYSAIKQNEPLRKALKTLEDGLREQGVLPPLTSRARSEKDSPQEYDTSANRRMENSRRVAQLEKENIDLKARVDELEKALLKQERFSEFHEVLEELGLVPR